MPGMKQHSFRREIVQLSGQHLAVIIIGLVVYLLDKFEGFNDATNYGIVIVMALLKSSYFIFHNFRSVRHTVRTERTFDHFIVLISVNIVLIVGSFATDYFALCKIYPDSFRGIFASNDGVLMFEMLYFSLVTFTTTGFGDIVPASNLARLLVSLEVVVAFVSIIFVLSNFSNFKEKA